MAGAAGNVGGCGVGVGGGALVMMAIMVGAWSAVMVVVAVRVVGEVVRQVITCLPGSPRHHCSRGDEPAGQQQPHTGKGQHLRLLAQGGHLAVARWHQERGWLPFT